MSARSPIKVVFDPDLPCTEDRDYFPVARPTSALTGAGVAFLAHRAWSWYRRTPKGHQDRMKSLNLLLVISSDTFETLKRRMQGPELGEMADGIIKGCQVILCDHMPRHDFINGEWVSRSAKVPADPVYENAQFEDSLILSPDGKTPLIAVRHCCMMAMEFVTCTDS